MLMCKPWNACGNVVFTPEKWTVLCSEENVTLSTLHLSVTAAIYYGNCEAGNQALANSPADLPERSMGSFVGTSEC